MLRKWFVWVELDVWLYVWFPLYGWLRFCHWPHVYEDHGSADACTYFSTYPGSDTSADVGTCRSPNASTDDDPSVSPAAMERCNERDDDCDGFTDETDAIDAITWYVDFDGDGFGRSDETLVGCSAPAYFADAAGDCDDDDELVYPGADEWCNDADDDCDGDIDEESEAFETLV